MKHIITFSETGQAGALYSDSLLPIFDALGPSRTARVSEVEPTEDGLWSVRILEWILGETKLLGTYRTRKEALEVEVTFLQNAL